MACLALIPIVLFSPGCFKALVILTPVFWPHYSSFCYPPGMAPGAPLPLTCQVTCSLAQQVTCQALYQRALSLPSEVTCQATHRLPQILTYRMPS